MRKIDLIVVHCADTPASMDVGAKEIRDWHVKENGWRDIGYHYVIRRNGLIEIGRPLAQVGSHVAGWNAASIGICLVGGKGKDGQPEDNFTPEQMSSLAAALKFFKLIWPDSEICGHHDLNSGKACPCFDVKAWWKR